MRYRRVIWNGPAVDRKVWAAIARGLRRHHPRPNNIWHLDTVVVTVKGQTFWLWRAVDQNGLVLDGTLQGRPNERLRRASNTSKFTAVRVKPFRHSALTIRDLRLEAFDAWNMAAIAV